MISTKGIVPMKVLTVVAVLSLTLLAVPALAQQKPPATPPPAAQKPVTPPPAAQPQPPAPFPEGAKIAYVSLQQVAGDSRDGKAARTQMEALQAKKVKELDDKRKQIEAMQTLLQSPTLAEDKRLGLSKDVDRGNTELQRMQQDAQAEVTELETELMNQFQRKLAPLAQQLAKEKGLQMILIANPQTMYWAEPGLDLSVELTRRLDAMAPGTTAKPPVPDSRVPPPPASPK
jgi:Skp family chaperone for outer membrane proteins